MCSTTLLDVWLNELPSSAMASVISCEAQYMSLCVRWKHRPQVCINANVCIAVA